jgi:alkylglycerol monooxygenase
MQEKVITLATPIFFLLIFIELIVGLLRRKSTYRTNDAVNSISLGVLSQISGVFMRVLRIGIYAWLVQHMALFDLPANSVWVWIFGLLLYDFCYYWLHRMSHEVNVLWAAHVVHHQSEDYNLSTALRQTSSGALFGWVFYVPMAVLGFPLEVFAVVALIDLLYQFWVHTQQIGKLGWFDRVFVSPSNHRVHHAVNDVYLDKNYGGILIVWDRLFGTFIEERDAETIVYGTRSPLRSWNPL